MKNFLFFFCLLLCTEAAAQEVTKDTSWIVANGIGKFYQITRVEYDNGSYAETAALIGDTLAMVSLYANQISSAAQQYSSAAIVAMRAQGATATLAKLDTIMTARLLRSPLTAVMASFEREFLAGTWAIIYNGTTTAVTFPRLSTNQRIRLLPAGSTARTMLLFGTMLRIVNYPVSGNNTLFQVRAGRWENLSRTIVLRRSGN